MASRIVAFLILLAFAVQATDGPHWCWYPINSDQISDGRVIAHLSGLSFYFTNPPTERAHVSAIVVDCEEERAVSGEIDTDNTHGDTVLHFPIHTLDGFRVAHMTIDFGRGSIALVNPHAGEHSRY
jgi:hypothetical protein